MCTVLVRVASIHSFPLGGLRHDPMRNHLLALGSQGLRYGWLPSVIHHGAPGEHWPTADPVKAGAISDPLDPPSLRSRSFLITPVVFSRPSDVHVDVNGWVGTDFDKAGSGGMAMRRIQ